MSLSERMNNIDIDWEELKTKYTTFWEGEYSGRCLLQVRLPKIPGDFGFIQKAVSPLFIADPKKDENDEINDSAIKEYIKTQKSCMQETKFIGDAFPDIFLNVGATGHTGFIKGSKYKMEGASYWFDPIIDSIDQNIAFDKKALLYKTTLKTAKILAEEDNGIIIGNPDVGGNLDCLSHVRGTDNLLIDMLTEKDWVKHNLNTFQSIWESFYNEFFSTTMEHNDMGSSVAWMGGPWAPGKLATTYCDMSVTFSPEMFEEFVIPELYRQCEYLDYSIYHLDGTEQLRHLDMLLSIKELDAIQWAKVAGQPSVVNYIGELKKMQEAGKKVIYFGTVDEAAELIKNLSSSSLFIWAFAFSEDDAAALFDLADKNAQM